MVKKVVKTKSAICITIGEQSENHAGMVKQGNGLAEHGYSIKELNEIKKKFEEMGGVAELIDMKNGLDGVEIEDNMLVDDERKYF